MKKFIMNQQNESQRQEHLKIKTRLIDKMFASVMGVFLKLRDLHASHIFF